MGGTSLQRQPSQVAQCPEPSAANNSNSSSTSSTTSSRSSNSRSSNSNNNSVSSRSSNSRTVPELQNYTPKDDGSHLRLGIQLEGMLQFLTRIGFCIMSGGQYHYTPYTRSAEIAWVDKVVGPYKG